MCLGPTPSPTRPPQAFYYPEEVGLAFGGAGSSRFLRLEVHYHNPLEIRGREFSAHVSIPASVLPWESSGLDMPSRGGGDWGVCPAWKPPSRWCSLLTTHRGRRPSYASPCSSPETVVGSLGWGPFLLAHRCTPRGGGPASHLPHKPPLPGTALQKRQAQASCVSICR